MPWPQSCTGNTSPYAHTGTFSRCTRSRAGVIADSAQGLDDLFVCLKNHPIFGHVFVECSFDPVSSYFLFTCYLTDDTCFLSRAIDWNWTKLVCNSARGWTAWPSGRSDPKHTWRPRMMISSRRSSSGTKKPNTFERACGAAECRWPLVTAPRAASPTGCVSAVTSCGLWRKKGPSICDCPSVSSSVPGYASVNTTLKFADSKFFFAIPSLTEGHILQAPPPRVVALKLVSGAPQLVRKEPDVAGSGPR